MIGAKVHDGGVKFRVWAPDQTSLEVEWVFNGKRGAEPLRKCADGTFHGFVDGIGAGALYQYRVGDRLLPDPASRFQPLGVHGPSAVVDAAAFEWTDDHWYGLTRSDLIIYELHVGTFSPAGTFRGVQDRLGYLRSLGVTAIELMPVAEFAGRRNWGYDGVDLFAPSHNYGTPDDLRRLVDAAHAHGLAVILDVVYNHLGPEGAYLSAFSSYYFTDAHATPWGQAVNLHGFQNERVREFFIENAIHWIREYHVDGLRLDATHQLHDEGPRPFLRELTDAVHASVDRDVVLIAEDERNENRLALPRNAGGYSLDAVWADDFHHHVRRRVAGDCEGYFQDFSGSTHDIANTLQRGWHYSGQVAPHTGEPRGSDPTCLGLEQFVICIQNHDQIGNRAFGDRLNQSIPANVYRAITALLLCAPETPMLFMGQEWGARTPFLYFTDMPEPLGSAISSGRRQEFASFSAFADPVSRASIPDPQDEKAHDASRLRWSELTRVDSQGLIRLHQALLALRRTDAAMTAHQREFVSVKALDEETIGMWRESRTRSHVVAIVARLEGGGRVCVPGAWQTVLTTEDSSFCSNGAPPRIEPGCRCVSVTFESPAAVVLRGALSPVSIQPHF